MGDAHAPATSRTSAVIAAPRDVLFRAFTDPAALEAWQVPEGMTGKVHAFDARRGG